jgi:hypothetical protein
MPINLPFIQPLSFQQANPRLMGIQAGSDLYSSFTNNLSKELENMKAKAELPYVGEKAKADLSKALLANKFQEIVNQYTPEEYTTKFGLERGQTANQLASANETNTLTPLKAKELSLKNEMYPDLTKAQINSYNMGGRGGLGVGGKEQLFYQSLVAKDNPQLQTQEQIYEAGNVLAQGGDTLSDGTKLNKLSPAAQASLDRVVKGTTTAPVITQGIRSNQGEAELNVLSKYAQEGLKPYGTTYFSKSPDQILDTFKSDETSQKRLGKFIASQQLQYELSQNEIKLAMGQPGVTTTEELMNLGQQRIDAQYPKLSYTARAEANRFFLEALGKALEARKNVKIGASSVTNQGNNNKKELTDSVQGAMNGNKPEQTVTARWTRNAEGKLVKE